MSHIQIFLGCYPGKEITKDTEKMSSPEWSPIIALVHDLQSHLIQSESTRSAYLDVLVDFYNLNDEARAPLPKPTDEDVLRYFRDNFPHVHIDSCLHPAGMLHFPDRTCEWRTDGEANNDIWISQDVILSMRLLKWGNGSAPDIHLSYNTFAISTVIMFLHGLHYSLIKHVFASLPNPPNGVRMDGSAYAHQGWSDWGLEDALFGFHIFGHWKSGPSNVCADMVDLTAQVEHPCKTTYSLASPEGALELEHFLKSLKTDTLYRMHLVDSMEVGSAVLPVNSCERVQTAFYLRFLVLSRMNVKGSYAVAIW